MNNFYTNGYSVINLYKETSSESEVVTQMIYGEDFKIINKFSNWMKIKIKDDGYIGYIKNKKFTSCLKTTHKISVLSANIYKNSNFNKKIGKLAYTSKLKIEKTTSKFSKFQGKWIETKNIKPIKHKNKNIFKDIKIFKNVKYKWGGKSFMGLDCSALIQLFFNFNNKYCPRDAKDQVKYFRKNVSLNNIKKHNIIFWRGHVAVAISKMNLIHAYGPAKKTVIMGINQTIRVIKKTAKLKILSIKKI